MSGLVVMDDEDPQLPAPEGSQVVRNATFGYAVDAYLNANAWVTDDHLGYVTALFKIANVLDYGGKGLTAALVMEYRQNFEKLRACAPVKADDDEDDFDKVVAGL
jgi:hypothetical protein